MTYLERQKLSQQTDKQLLAQCETDTYRASGPGGQKRNKTDSAVRIRHPETGLLVIAEESRSQHENRAKALLRLRQAFYLKLRVNYSGHTTDSDRFPGSEVVQTLVEASGKLRLSRKHPQFWEVVGIVLDVLQASAGKVSEAAEMLGLTTGNLIDFLQTSPKVWEQANHMRKEFGHKPLRSS